jgi:hypothetical protein
MGSPRPDSQAHRQRRGEARGTRFLPEQKASWWAGISTGMSTVALADKPPFFWHLLTLDLACGEGNKLSLSWVVTGRLVGNELASCGREGPPSYQGV